MIKNMSWTVSSQGKKYCAIIGTAVISDINCNKPTKVYKSPGAFAIQCNYGCNNISNLECLFK